MRYALRFPSWISAALLLSMVAAGPGSATTCAAPAERLALEGRVLQSHLMVAALACDQRQRYNAFVERFRGELVRNGKTVRSFFHRSYGGGAESEINRFVTRIANQASARSLSGEFCSGAASIFEQLEKQATADFIDVAAAQPFADSHGIASCR